MKPALLLHSEVAKYRYLNVLREVEVMTSLGRTVESTKTSLGTVRDRSWSFRAAMADALRIHRHLFGHAGHYMEATAR